MLSGSPSEKGLRNGGRDGCGRTRLYLNVYDLTPINKYLYWFGLGVFHSGIEVHGQEYGFGAHDYPSSGVFEVEPKSCPGFIFRRSVWLGTTDMSRSEFRILIEDLAGKYHGDTYNLIIKNCNHFTDEVCMHLTGKSIPGWVNRLARLGSFFRCIIPENIRVSAVGQLPTHPTCFDEFDSFSSSSIEDSDEEDADHHLVKRPNIEFVHSSDEPLRLARDVM
nr:PREDICTED: deSI-like protein At4g17486 isoform X4 [Musa acuminata subsp. malaccensis]